MANEDLSYKVQVSIDGKYRPSILRGRLLHEQTHRLEFPSKRKASDTNLDLWLDGSIYPLDSLGKCPKFRDVRSLLEFVGKGDKGLHGYTCNLSNSLPPEVTSDCVRKLRETEFYDLRQCL